MKEELRKKMGAVLKLERERLDVKRDELAEQLKISDAYLERIEQGTSEGLPSDIYFELFTKSYAEAIGVDYSATTEALKEELAASMPPAVGDKPASKAKQAAPDKEADTNEDLEEEEPGLRHLKKLGIMLAGIAGLLIVFIVVYKLFLAGDPPVDDQSGVNEGQSEQTVDAEESARITDYDWDVPAYEPPAPLTLKLRARDASWATILADGDTVIFRGLGVGREYEVSANYRIQVSIAVPGVVETELNGQAIDLRDPETQRISRVVIDQLNVSKFLASVPAGEETPPQVPTNQSPSIRQSSLSGKTQSIPAGPKAKDSTITAEGADTTKGGTVEL